MAHIRLPNVTAYFHYSRDSGLSPHIRAECWQLHRFRVHLPARLPPLPGGLAKHGEGRGDATATGIDLNGAAISNQAHLPIRAVDGIAAVKGDGPVALGDAEGFVPGGVDKSKRSLRP